jgi:hypothetical protein
MGSYELLDETVEIPNYVLGPLLDDMAALSVGWHQEVKAKTTVTDVTPRTASLVLAIDDTEYTVGYGELIKAFEGVLGELRSYPAAVLADGYTLQVANCIANKDASEIKTDELLEDLLRLALEAAGWKER